MRHVCFPGNAVKIIINTANITGDIAMNKVLGLALVIYFLGDPSLSMLEGLTSNADYVIALVTALVTIPWVTAQIDN